MNNDFNLDNEFDFATCQNCIGEVEEIDIIENQINYNSANQIICATSG